MNDQLDIVDYIKGKYPHIPGHKGAGGSQDAALLMVKASLAIQHKILRYMVDGVNYTADEIAEGLKLPVTTVRSRLDELMGKKQVKQLPEEMKRPNANGIKVLTWVLADTWNTVEW